MTNMLQGIDVSAAQGVINWDSVLSSGAANFVFCKATEGLSYVDTRFHFNWDSAKARGFIRGAYHFAHLSQDAVQEANFFVNTVGALDPADMLVLDIETASISGSQFTDWTLAWLETVEKQSGTTPIVYTGGPFFNSHGGNPDPSVVQRLSRFPLWLAAYVSNPAGYVPSEWKNLGWKFWQRSGDQAAAGDTILHVPGIYGNVDKDEFVGSLDDLRQFALNLHPGANNGFTGAVNSISSST
jgi:Lyzozyme M1 (1,4-beta-N-acetylmuramidase)